MLVAMMTNPIRFI